MQDEQPDLGALFAANLPDRVHEGHVLGGLAVDFEDEVARLQSGLERRGVFDGRDNDEASLVEAYFDADAAEFACGVDLHVLVIGRGEVGGVGVQLFNHTLDGVVDEVLAGHGLDVITLNHVKHL